MKIIIALFLLAALCTIEAFPASIDLEILRIRVRNMKWDVATIIRRLEQLRLDSEEDTHEEVLSKWEKEQNNYREYKNILLSSIRSDIDAAKAEGKNVDACYEEAKSGVKLNEEVAYEGAVKCQNVAQDSIHSNLAFLDNLIETGNSLNTELDNVFLKCFDNDAFRMQSCILGELARIENDLKSLISDTTTAEITIYAMSKNVVTQANNCIKQSYSRAYTEGVTVRLAVAQCIATAEPSNP